MNDTTPELLSFPTEYPFKIVGANRPDFGQSVIDVFARHAPGFDAGRVDLKQSRNGNYLAVNVTIVASGRAQLDLIYRDLVQLAGIRFVL